MRHFFRCGTHPDDVMARADAFFPAIGLTTQHTAPRSRTFAGELGTLTLTVRMEGGHYTFVEAHTDQTGESRLDRSVKRYFVQLHKAADPTHALDAAY
ncbi:MAG TPA: hypothetical protein VE967_12425 [Gemmatimonadaceae bacterium]|nr:hypothetical protein [Gemmatimonadaceae bacterium]